MSFGTHRHNIITKTIYIIINLNIIFKVKKEYSKKPVTPFL